MSLSLLRSPPMGICKILHILAYHHCTSFSRNMVCFHTYISRCHDHDMEVFYARNHWQCRWMDLTFWYLVQKPPKYYIASSSEFHWQRLFPPRSTFSNGNYYLSYPSRPRLTSPSNNIWWTDSSWYGLLEFALDLKLDSWLHKTRLIFVFDYYNYQFVSA